VDSRKTLFRFYYRVFSFLFFFSIVIECEKIDNLTDPNLRIAVLSRQVGGEIMFSCMQGFGLDGPTHSTCLPTGEWEQPFPTCAGIYNIFDTIYYYYYYDYCKTIEGEAIAFLRVLSDFEKLIPSPSPQPLPPPTTPFWSRALSVIDML